jgi:hypothetical protein
MDIIKKLYRIDSILLKTNDEKYAKTMIKKRHLLIKESNIQVCFNCGKYHRNENGFCSESCKKTNIKNNRFKKIR